MAFFSPEAEALRKELKKKIPLKVSIRIPFNSYIKILLYYECPN